MQDASRQETRAPHQLASPHAHRRRSHAGRRRSQACLVARGAPLPASALRRAPSRLKAADLQQKWPNLPPSASTRRSSTVP